MADYLLMLYNNESDFLNHTGRSYTFNRTQTLLNNMSLNNIKNPAKCGGKAICGYCRIKLLSDQKYCSKPNNAEKSILNQEEIKSGWRLACQLYSLRDISIVQP